MSMRTFLGGCVISAAAVAGCYTGSDVNSTTMGSTNPASTTSVDATDPSAMSGFPCDVAQVLAKSCAGCHGSAPSGGAPNAMMTYDDLMATSASAPSTSVAEVSLARMKDTKSPMPPEGASAEDVAVIEKWIAAGMPSGSAACDVAPVASLYDTPSTCTSGSHWTRGNRGSQQMKPGGACIQCHDREGEGPSYSAAGTVYATAHEPDDCNGSSAASIKVVVTGADGVSQTATVNSAGNFYFRSAIKMPYKAKVVSGSKSRAMATAQTDGDCNKCHTEAGTKKAPGRVMAP
jgi:mono/diheme cytochrome c family protein